MQIVGINELKELIKEYKLTGMPVSDLEKTLTDLKQRQGEPIISVEQRVKKNQDGSCTITYSIGPIRGLE